jgi:hypothetical protein
MLQAPDPQTRTATFNGKTAVSCRSAFGPTPVVQRQSVEGLPWVNLSRPTAVPRAAGIDSKPCTQDDGRELPGGVEIQLQPLATALHAMESITR